MTISGDYHTHSKYSNGENTILENSLVAAEKGLKQLAICDHGFSSLAFNLKRKKLSKMKLDCSMAEFKSGVRVFCGVEANFIGMNGEIDCKTTDEFQVVCAGYHKYVRTTCKFFFKFILSNWLKEFFMGTKKYHNASKSKNWVKTNTQLVVDVLHKNIVDVLVHPNRHFRIDTLTVAKACEKTKTYWELNNGNLGCSLEELKEIVKETDCKFVLSSDAHKAQNVGNIEKVWEKIKDIVPEYRIANINGRTMARKQWA